MRKIGFILVFVMGMLSLSDAYCEGVCSSFWGCRIGANVEVVKENLQKQNIAYREGNKMQNIFISSREIDGIAFATCCLCFSPIDGSFYKLIGSNRFEEKSDAMEAYEKYLSQLRENYENLQILRHPKGAEKMCSYTDGENALYLGLFKMNNNGKTQYYVNVNYWSNYLEEKIKE